MAEIVCIHGIAQELKSSESLLDEWAPSLRGGVSNAGGSIDGVGIGMGFYGGLFRLSGAKGGESIPVYKPGDLEDALEIALVQEIFDSLAPAPTSSANAKGALELARRSVTQMLQVIASAPYFGQVAQSVVIWYLKQVYRYVTDPTIRQAARNSLIAKIGEDTRVVVAHSLGTVVAYEVLAANPQLPVQMLVTLGSPLGIPALLPRLDPPLLAAGDHCPAGLRHWVNIADAADVVALRKDLGSLYGARVTDYLVHNKATMHHVEPYLTAPETGRAVLAGLAEN